MLQSRLQRISILEESKLDQEHIPEIEQHIKNVMNKKIISTTSYFISNLKNPRFKQSGLNFYIHLFF